MDKKENRQRALQMAEMLHKAVEKSLSFNFDQLVDLEPLNFLETQCAWMSSYYMLCSAEKQEELLNEVRNLQEQQKHILESMSEESRKSSKTNRRISIASVFIASVAIIFSILAFCSSSFWQKEQIPLLQKIVDNTQQEKSSK